MLDLNVIKLFAYVKTSLEFYFRTHHTDAICRQKQNGWNLKKIIFFNLSWVSTSETKVFLSRKSAALPLNTTPVLRQSDALDLWPQQGQMGVLNGLDVKVETGLVLPASVGSEEGRSFRLQSLLPQKKTKTEIYRNPPTTHTHFCSSWAETWFPAAGGVSFAPAKKLPW